MTDFESRLVFIPGGSTGIGLAIARRFAARGADVVIFARREQPLIAAAAAIRSACRRDAQHVVWRQLDVADAEQVRTVLGAAVTDIGVPDVLVNCAGRAIANYFERIPLAQVDESMRINFYGAWHAISTLLPHMQGRGGYIVNVASLAGLIGVFGYSDYAASKFALVGFSEVLRSEVAERGIPVSVLCPPDTQTPGFERENLTKPPETLAISEGGGVLSAEEVADALLAGMAKREFLIIPGRDARTAHRIKRFFPRLGLRILDRSLRRAKRDRR
jgi:short-subunit dehydrogenase